MIELPEAVNLAKQLTETIKGKMIKEVIAGYSPHKFAWYHGDPADYNTRLQGKIIGATVSYGGLIEMHADDYVLLFGDGVALRFHGKDEKRPSKHQLLVEFEDDTQAESHIAEIEKSFKDGVARHFGMPYYRHIYS